MPSLLTAGRIIYKGFLLLIFWLNQTQAMAAQLGYWLTHTVVFAWMDSWSKCQYCCMLLWSSVTIIKFENHYCYHTQNKSKNNNKFSKNDKKVRTDNFFNQWLWVTQWLSDLQRYCKQTGLALQPAAWHHFKVIPDSSRTIWPALWRGQHITIKYVSDERKEFQK